MIKPFVPYSGSRRYSWENPGNTYVANGFYGADPELRSDDYSTAWKKMNHVNFKSRYLGFSDQAYMIYEPWINRNICPAHNKIVQ